MSPPPWELVTAHHTWKTIRHRKFWDWPQHAFALLCCPISGWLQRRWGWCSVDAPASPTSFSELPIYFLWQFAQIVKIPCNYSCIWKPNMIYFWQAQSSLGWLRVFVCMSVCVGYLYVCTCWLSTYVYVLASFLYNRVDCRSYACVPSRYLLLLNLRDIKFYKALK